jgi:hypothetical protein
MSAAAAAIEYALSDKCDGEGDAMDFLRYWNEGEFDVLRSHWEDIPDAVFIGADQFHPGSDKFEREQNNIGYRRVDVVSKKIGQHSRMVFLCKTDEEAVEMARIEFRKVVEHFVNNTDEKGQPEEWLEHRRKLKRCVESLYGPVVDGKVPSGLIGDCSVEVLWKQAEALLAHDHDRLSVNPQMLDGYTNWTKWGRDGWTSVQYQKPVKKGSKQ